MTDGHKRSCVQRCLKLQPVQPKMAGLGSPASSPQGLLLSTRHVGLTPAPLPSRPNLAVQSLVYAAAAAFLVRIVEPLHGARELVKYLAATIILTSFATVRQCQSMLTQQNG